MLYVFLRYSSVSQEAGYNVVNENDKEECVVIRGRIWILEIVEMELDLKYCYTF